MKDEFDLGEEEREERKLREEEDKLFQEQLEEEMRIKEEVADNPKGFGKEIEDSLLNAGFKKLEIYRDNGTNKYPFYHKDRDILVVIEITKNPDERGYKMKLKRRSIKKYCDSCILKYNFSHLPKEKLKKIRIKVLK